ncbi:glutamate-cysteine ligase family protein [Myceligenerans pegani]|uniref:Glutamate--cysteine ligase n=1 Tax=Myceligenerans pegani TaxID=2776917 RepID=A0ABR9MWR5_9MICO|nr:glutamate-cysteine ligase family protein [Myceligenerans sp. TRM 65318]MBE1875839.1 glutamate--cysteine ligase [Myceligenerans sp. TRM 65318]MBE3018110.1 glutamate--cysteine ligase [Myceligenerans sp. TRM 65318]
MLYKCGLEFEYVLVDSSQRLRDFTSLDFRALDAALAGGEGADDASLTRGDLGIKSGYWYLEGDERFGPDGTFLDLRVKGVEIRTPIGTDLAGTADQLLRLQGLLEERLAPLGLGLGIVGFHPTLTEYRIEPPLNDWERAMRAEHHEYGHANVSNVSFGPDVNLSFPGLDDAGVVDLTRKLTHYSPYLVPFSFSSPFFDGGPWGGPSRRTHERTWRRVAARCFVEREPDPAVSPVCLYRPRVPAERGRIEFKAYDAFLDRAHLLAGATLVLGVCLSGELPGRDDVPSRELHQRAASAAFGAPEIADGAARVLEAARKALAMLPDEAALLAPFADLLDRRRTPADDLLDDHARTGLMFRPGGLR